MSGIHITDPADGSRQQRGVVFPLSWAQQFQAGVGGSVATIQQSPHPDGPWETCEGFGQGGAIEANPVPWDARDTSYTLPEVRQWGATCVRVAIFADQGLTGPPVHVSPPVHYLKPLVATTVPAPDVPRAEPPTTSAEEPPAADGPKFLRSTMEE